MFKIINELYGMIMYTRVVVLVKLFDYVFLNNYFFSIYCHLKDKNETYYLYKYILNLDYDYY